MDGKQRQHLSLKLIEIEIIRLESDNLQKWRSVFWEIEKIEFRVGKIEEHYLLTDTFESENWCL